MGSLRPRLEGELRVAWSLQGDQFVRKLETYKGGWADSTAGQPAFPGWESSWEEVAESTTTRFVNPIVRTIKAALVSGGAQLLGDLALQGAFNLANPEAVRYIQQHGAELVSGINETTKGYMRTIIRDGLEKGWSYDKLADEINNRFVGFGEERPQEHIRSRAHLVATVEIGNAYEAGSAITAQELRDGGLVMEKAWLTVGDGKAYEEGDPCGPNEQQGWIPLDQPFSSGDMQPLGHPACRCTALYRRKPGVNR